MKSKKLGTVFLSMLLVFTLIIAVGCGKDEEEEKKQDDSKKTAEVDKKDEPKKTEENSSDTKKTVKLLKRNGVEWKENTKINSKRGAKSYKVVWGDTLSLIARTWHVNCYRLAKYNNIKNIDLIEVDQIIYNPAYKK